MAVAARTTYTEFMGIIRLVTLIGFGAITVIVEDGLYGNMTVAPIAYNGKQTAYGTNRP